MIIGFINKDISKYYILKRSMHNQIKHKFL